MADTFESPVDDAPPRGELVRPPSGSSGGPGAGGRVPPHNIQAEESLIGAMMLSKDAIAAAMEAVGADDFYKPAHAHVFDAISVLYAAGEPVDAVTVAAQLRRAELFDGIGGAATLAHLQASTPATSNASHYAKIVEEHSLMRKLIGVAGEIADIGYGQPDDVEKAVDQAESMVFQVAERKVSDTLSPIHDLMEGSLDRLEALYERGDSITGIATGYHDLDEVLSGLQKGALVVVGARPAMGKTALALGMVANAALEAQRPVLLFSLEMSHLELTQRMLCSEARVDSKRIRTGNLAEADWSKISHAVGRLGDAPIWIDDNPNTTVMEIRAKARRLKAKIGDLGLVVVDYLQLMTGRNGAESRQVEVAEISRGLKILARELETPVVALSQLSRGLEQRTDKRPMLADLRESGCLTADSRIVRADTGAEVTMGELLESGERNIPVWTLDERYRLVRGEMSHVFPSGTKRVYELRLASGRTLKASGNHPFLQLGGWTPLDDLEVGDRVAVARSEPWGDSGSRSDEIPADVWDLVRKAMPEHGVTARALAAGLEMQYCGSALYKSGVSRQRLARVAQIVPEPALEDLATSDVLWDRVVAIEDLGEQPVFDATVEGTHNFVANGMVVHNSIEQDADVVLFIYRDEVYDPESPHRGTAELIISKHRNGPTGVARVAFLDHFTRFENMAKGV